MYFGLIWQMIWFGMVWVLVDELDHHQVMLVCSVSVREVGAPKDGQTDGQSEDILSSLMLFNFICYFLFNSC